MIDLLDQLDNLCDHDRSRIMKTMIEDLYSRIEVLEVKAAFCGKTVKRLETLGKDDGDD